jgi:hypothetical protein
MMINLVACAAWSQFQLGTDFSSLISDFSLMFSLGALHIYNSIPRYIREFIQRNLSLGFNIMVFTVMREANWNSIYIHLSSWKQ